MSRPPAWERLRATTSAPLTVRPPERVELEVARMDDGDLVDAPVRGATVFLAARRAEGFELWAARVDDDTATTFRVVAGRLAIRSSDAAAARLLGFDPDRPPPDVSWAWDSPDGAAPDASGDLICPCEGIPRGEVVAAIGAGCRSVDAVKRATKATFGVCQSRSCAGEIATLIGLAAHDPRAAITPRPPLVPVPASVLAAFGPQEG